MPFTISIVGRPNVGKSTLFNKLVGRKFAIVDDTPGVTRDRRETMGNIGPIEFRIIDTAGLEYEIAEDKLESRMMKQTEIAVLESDLCLLIVDGREGLNSVDKHFAQWVRKHGKDTVLVANKCEGKDYGYGFDTEYYKLGFGEPVGISAEHKEGFNTLYEAIEPYYDKYQQKFKEFEVEGQERGDRSEEDEDKKHLQLVIVGRPNAGKSTLINNLLGQERLITGPEAGITRDSISTEWEFEGQPIYLIDTAGIRKKAQITKSLERMFLADSFRAIRYAHIVIIMIDATTTLKDYTSIDKQDLAIASMAIKEGRGIVFGINKWDEIKEKNVMIKEIRRVIETTIPNIKGIPIIPISALKKQNTHKLIREALNVYDSWNKRISTAKLNDWLKFVTEAHTPPMKSGRSTKIKYITQAKTRPPTFIVFTNYIEKVKGAYERYLVNALRKDFKLSCPIRIILKKSENPYKRG
ncbi:ribosome biogenesis GTPase Der [Pseudomonadota bacterium]